MNTWSYNAELGREQQNVPVFAAGSYLGQIEEVGMAHTRRGEPKLAITFRVWSAHPQTPGAISRTVNEHLVKDGHPTAVQLSAKRSVELSESLGMQATGEIPIAGLKGQWVGVVLSDKVETFRGKEGTDVTTPVNRIRGYCSPQAATGPQDPSRPVIHPPIQRTAPAAPPAPAHPGYAPQAGHAPAPPAPAGTPPAGLPPAPGYAPYGPAAPGYPSGQLDDDEVPY